MSRSAPLVAEAPLKGDAVPPPPVSRRRKAVLFFAFAFAVMADPVSSVAYAIEAALRSLGGHLELLLPTMGLVIGVIALVTLNYWQLVKADTSEPLRWAAGLSVLLGLRVWWAWRKRQPLRS